MRFLSPLFFLAALFAQESAEFRNWLNQGGQAFREVQYAVAIQAFQRAIDLNPSSLTAHLYPATAYMQQYIPGVESNENSQVAALRKGSVLTSPGFRPHQQGGLGFDGFALLERKEVGRCAAMVRKTDCG